MTKASIFSLILVILSTVCEGNVIHRAKSPRDLVDPVPERVFKVRTAQILLADYPLIRADFPITRTMSEPEIDSWLLNHTAFISSPHTEVERTNSKIELQLKNHPGTQQIPVSREALRPEYYGRALVYQVEDGLIDVKGAGAATTPILASHKTGLASLGEMIREFLFQKKVQQVLVHSGSGLETVECYAVIDWGFDTKELNGKEVRAGAVLRQGHGRVGHTASHFANDVDTTIIEKLLRHYGISSTGDGTTNISEHANIQTSREGSLVDFGAYVVMQEFKRTVFHYGTRALLISPRDPDFIKVPDWEIQVPNSAWGSSESGIEGPQYDNPWIWSHRLAAAIKAGQSTRKNATLHFNNMMGSGDLPPHRAGRFKDIMAQSRARIAKDLALRTLDFSLNQFQSLIETNGKDLSEAEVIQSLSKFGATETPALKIVEILNKVGLLEKFPGLWNQIIPQLDPGPSSEIYFYLLTHNKANLINPFIENSRSRSTKDLIAFLVSSEASSHPNWRLWLNTAFISNRNFGAEFMTQEPRALLFPEGIQILYPPSGTNRASLSQLVKMVEAEHWSRSPEILLFAYDRINRIQDPVFKQDLLGKLKDSSNWRANSGYLNKKISQSPLCQGVLLKI